mmetsp:Transcript_58502/g.163996  ORF Transcript_58502/g.163996 Transcript_58502/m.163996 type:complete len:211 (+) Transcript_58502:1270-1902(+)
MSPFSLHSEISARFLAKSCSRLSVIHACLTVSGSQCPSASQIWIPACSLLIDAAPTASWSTMSFNAASLSFTSAAEIAMATSLCASSRAWCSKSCAFAKSAWLVAAASSSLPNFSFRNFCACKSSGLVCPWSRDCLMPWDSLRMCKWSSPCSGVCAKASPNKVCAWSCNFFLAMSTVAASTPSCDASMYSVCNTNLSVSLSISSLSNPCT